MKKVYDFPFRWDFSLNIALTIEIKWVKTEIKKKIEYQQATIKETIEEMAEIDKEGIDKFITKFLQKCEFTENELIMLSMKPDVIERIMQTFLLTRYRWVFDEEALKNPKQSLKDTSGVPYAAILAMVAEKLHVDPITFQDTYTMEQLAYLMWWIEYWINAQTEEWQQRNKQKYGKDEQYDNMLISKLKNL